MAGYWRSIKNKAQKADVTFFRPLSLPVSLLQNRVLLVHPVSVLYEVITLLVLGVYIDDNSQVGTMCLVAIYYLRSNTRSWDQEDSQLNVCEMY